MSLTSPEVISNDLNKTIAAAVNAKVEAGVLQALSSDDVLGRFVAAALNEPVRREYGQGDENFVGRTVREAIKKATQEAAKRAMELEMPAIEEMVRKELRKRIGDISKGIAEQVVKSTTGYGMRIEFLLPKEYVG